jgi:hypothetical protein
MIQMFAILVPSLTFLNKEHAKNALTSFCVKIAAKIQIYAYLVKQDISLTKMDNAKLAINKIPQFNHVKNVNYPQTDLKLFAINVLLASEIKMELA